MSPINLKGYLTVILEAATLSLLQDLKNKIASEKKVFVLLSGGFGSGKSYVINDLLQISPDAVVDIDDIKTKKNLTSSKAIREVAGIIESMLQQGNALIVQQGTSANLASTKRKIEKAKKFGYTTILLNIERDLDDQVKSLFKRGKETGRGFEKDDSSLPMEQRIANARSLVEFKNRKAKEVFDALKDFNDLDFVITFRNELKD